LGWRAESAPQRGFSPADREEREAAVGKRIDRRALVDKITASFPHVDSVSLAALVAILLSKNFAY
jgi:hypothetical protein